MDAEPVNIIRLSPEFVSESLDVQGHSPILPTPTSKPPVIFDQSPPFTSRFLPFRSRFRQGERTPGHSIDHSEKASMGGNWNAFSADIFL